ncbi:hypothetical protein F8388_002943 [Cannabis sativa]|nr:hypothetical protein F8388_002943 [Cannabis sativa]
MLPFSHPFKLVLVQLRLLVLAMGGMPILSPKEVPSFLLSLLLQFLSRSVVGLARNLIGNAQVKTQYLLRQMSKRGRRDLVGKPRW